MSERRQLRIVVDAASWDARHAEFDLDQLLRDLGHELLLPDPSADAEKVPRDAQVLARRLERGRLVGLAPGEVVELGEVVPLFDRCEDVDPVVELVREVKDVVVERAGRRRRDEVLPDPVVHLAPLRGGDERVGGW